MLSIWQRPPFGESMHFLLCHLCALKPLLLGDFLTISTCRSIIHSVKNMVAEVTLHNNIEMSKNCKKWQKSPKIAQNCLKLKGYLSNYIFHTVYSRGSRQCTKTSSKSIIEWFSLRFSSKEYFLLFWLQAKSMNIMCKTFSLIINLFRVYSI